MLTQLKFVEQELCIFYLKNLHGIYFAAFCSIYMPMYKCDSENQLSHIYYSMIIKGYRRPLETKDLWTLNNEDQSATVSRQLDQEWNKELKKKYR